MRAGNKPDWQFRDYDRLTPEQWTLAANYLGAAYRIGLGYLERRGCTLMVEDLILDALVHAVLSYDGRITFYGWLRRCVISRLINGLSSEGIRARRQGELCTRSHPDRSRGGTRYPKREVGWHAVQAEARDLVQHLLGRLRPRQADLMRLIYLEGYTLPAAARALGLPGTSARILHRDAMDRFRWHLRVDPAAAAAV